MKSNGLIFLGIVLLFPCVAHAQAPSPDVTTWHNRNERTGWQGDEQTLTPSTVSQSSFGLLWQWTVSAPVYAQPLAVSNLPALNNCPAPCSALYVATEDDNIYAFNAAADPNTPPIWTRNVAAFLGGTAVDCNQQL